MGHEEGICENQHFLIGNSATITNNHFDAFQLLKKYKPKGLRVYVPLSYGDSEYAEMVKKEGEILFKDQFAPIEDFLSKGQFNQVLNDCGNIIMNQLRQQGLGTILVAFVERRKTVF
jgi:dTDP-N-acetylfucosamine:lipid II N-acetylfucosaminyltransferase